MLALWGLQVPGGLWESQTPEHLPELPGALQQDWGGLTWTGSVRLAQHGSAGCCNGTAQSGTACEQHTKVWRTTLPPDQTSLDLLCGAQALQVPTCRVPAACGAHRPDSQESQAACMRTRAAVLAQQPGVHAAAPLQTPDMSHSAGSSKAGPAYEQQVSNGGTLHASLCTCQQQ